MNEEERYAVNDVVRMKTFRIVSPSRLSQNIEKGQVMPHFMMPERDLLRIVGFQPALHEIKEKTPEESESRRKNKARKLCLKFPNNAFSSRVFN